MLSEGVESTGVVAPDFTIALTSFSEVSAIFNAVNSTRLALDLSHIVQASDSKPMEAPVT